MKKGWGKLGFAVQMPWEGPDADLMDAVIFGTAASQHGQLYALRMWKHFSEYVQILREFPDDDDAQAMLEAYLMSLDSQDATEFVAFNRTSRAAGLSMLAKHGGSGATTVNPRARCATYGLLPFSEPIYPAQPDDDLPF